MASKKMVGALNKQLNAEYYSSYLYLAMSAYFETIDLRGFASWMRVQSGEEMKHAMKFYDFIIDRDETVELTKVQQPPTEWKSALAAVEDAYEHEKEVTSSIYELVSLSTREKDYATYEMLQWFVKEQVEEEKSAHDIIQDIKRVEDVSTGLLYLDRELAKRKAEA
ncbi:MAG TPA: ferritin [Nitrososphaerales archaeon]|nr:ferritin [Nitrososphaerales archaeon]